MTNENPAAKVIYQTNDIIWKWTVDTDMKMHSKVVQSVGWGFPSFATNWLSRRPVTLAGIHNKDSSFWWSVEVVVMSFLPLHVVQLSVSLVEATWNIHRSIQQYLENRLWIIWTEHLVLYTWLKCISKFLLKFIKKILK